MGLIYLNNAATSYPKPLEVRRAVAHCLESAPVEPGRTGGKDDPVSVCRVAVAQLLGVPDPLRVALMPSCTHALNSAILGLARPGGHVVTTILEHNSVLRPLAHLRANGTNVSFVSPQNDGSISVGEIVNAIRPSTQAVVLTHASNVTGSILPIEEIAREVARRRVTLVIDAAQSAGSVPIDCDALEGRVFLAFAGHKGLYGPSGTGGLVVPDDALEQTLFGGTGVRSESELHPAELPLRHEAGTPNLPGLSGLTAGVEFVAGRGVRALGAHKAGLIDRVRRGLAEIRGVELAPLAAEDGRAGVTSFTLESWPPEEVGFALREAFGIEVRTGLHCAPKTHAWMGTRVAGNVRVSVGVFNTDADVDALVAGVRKLVSR